MLLYSKHCRGFASSNLSQYYGSCSFSEFSCPGLLFEGTAQFATLHGSSLSSLSSSIWEKELGFEIPKQVLRPFQLTLWISAMESPGIHHLVSPEHSPLPCPPPLRLLLGNRPTLTTIITSYNSPGIPGHSNCITALFMCYSSHSAESLQQSSSVGTRRSHRHQEKLRVWNSHRDDVSWVCRDGLGSVPLCVSSSSNQTDL